MTGSQAPEEKVEGKRSDPFLFAAHDAVNVLVLLFGLALPYTDPSLLVRDYMDAKVLHLFQPCPWHQSIEPILHLRITHIHGA